MSNKVEIGKRFEGGRREILVNGKHAGQINVDTDYVNGGWKQRFFTAKIFDNTYWNWSVDRFENENSPLPINTVIARLLKEMEADLNDAFEGAVAKAFNR